MHKRNVAIGVLAWAGVITLLIAFTPRLNHSTFMGYFQFPAILLTMLLTHGDGHDPGILAAWTGFLTYTFLYVFVAIFLWVLSLEFTYLFLAKKSLHRAVGSLARGETSPGVAQEQIDLAIARLEARHRKSVFLKNPAPAGSVVATESLSDGAMGEPVFGPVAGREIDRIQNRLAVVIGSKKAAKVAAELRAKANEGGTAGPTPTPPTPTSPKPPPPMAQGMG